MIGVEFERAIEVKDIKENVTTAVNSVIRSRKKWRV